MRYCRDKHKYTPESMAALLGISTIEYQKLETGKKLLTIKQVRQLEKLYNVRGDYFYTAARQLDMLLASQEVINIQKETISQLKKKLGQLEKLSSTPQ